MAAAADVVYQDFVDRIAALTPTNLLGLDGRFELLADQGVSPSESAPRTFAVYWESSGAEHIAGGEAITEGLDYRVADHSFRVEVYYPASAGWQTLQKAVLSDRHDLTELLRHPSSYSSSIWRRYREADDLGRGDDVWTYSATWRVTIQESEI